MAITHEDGILDNRGCGYFLFCVCVECLSFVFITMFCWISYFRVKKKSCNGGGIDLDLANLLYIQAISSSIGLILIGPHTSEVVSAGHSYFNGLRELSKEKRFFFLLVFHALFEFTWWIYSIVSVSITRTSSCEFMNALWKMIGFQAPLVLFRVFIHVIIPIARSHADGTFYLFSKPVKPEGGISKDIPQVALTKEQIEIRDMKLKKARERANLDVNFHEYQNAFVNKRKLLPLKDVKTTNGDARKHFDALEEDLMAQGSNKGSNKGGGLKLPPLKNSRIYPLNDDEDMRESDKEDGKKKKKKKKQNNDGILMIGNGEGSSSKGRSKGRGGMDIAIHSSSSIVQMNAASSSTLSFIKSKAAHPLPPV